MSSTSRPGGSAMQAVQSGARPAVSAPDSAAATTRAPIAWRTLLPLALVTLLGHLIMAGHYGWFRDELYYVAAGKHLAGGYVELPVMVALLADLQRALFGPAPAAILVLPAVAGALIVVATGLLAREMGGGRLAQSLAALCALVAPAFVGSSALFTMDVFDELWWTLAALVLARILSAYAQPVNSLTGSYGILPAPGRLRRGRQDAGAPSNAASHRDSDFAQTRPAFGPQGGALVAGSAKMARGRLWLLFGLVCGVGLLTKLTILAFGLAVTLGLLLTPARAELRTRWPYLAAAFALAFLLPYAAWQVGHDWATLAFWRNYHHGQDTGAFLVQVVLLMQPLALPLWAAGLWSLLRAPYLAPFRVLGWAFLLLCALFLIGHAKSYFLAPAFPPLYAAGAIAVERYARRRPRTRLVPLTAGALLLGGAALAPVVAPILPPGTLAALMPSPIQPVADRFGWPQYVGTVAAVYRGLPAKQQAETTILAGNYGEAGALDLLGPAYHLPRAISPHNTYYFWGQGVTPGAVVIATDFDRSDLLRYFASVRQVATIPAQDGIHNEEVGRAVWLCRGLKVPWATVWPQLKNFS